MATVMRPRISWPQGVQIPPGYIVDWDAMGVPTPAAYWLMHNECGALVQDLSQQQQHGALAPNLRWQRGGLYFPRSTGTDFVTCPTLPQTLDPKVSIWVSMFWDQANFEQYYVDWRLSGGGGAYLGRTADGSGMRHNIYTGGVNTTLTTSQPVGETGKLCNIVVSAWRNVIINVYRDGNLIGSAAAANNAMGVNGPFRIAGHRDTNVNFIPKGWMYSFAVWDDFLSSSHAQAVSGSWQVYLPGAVRVFTFGGATPTSILPLISQGGTIGRSLINRSLIA